MEGLPRWTNCGINHRQVTLYARSPAERTPEPIVQSALVVHLVRLSWTGYSQHHQCNRWLLRRPEEQASQSQWPLLDSETKIYRWVFEGMRTSRWERLIRRFRSHPIIAQSSGLSLAGCSPAEPTSVSPDTQRSESQLGSPTTVDNSPFVLSIRDKRLPKAIRFVYYTNNLKFGSVDLLTTAFARCSCLSINYRFQTE